MLISFRVCSPLRGSVVLLRTTTFSVRGSGRAVVSRCGLLRAFRQHAFVGPGPESFAHHLRTAAVWPPGFGAGTTDLAGITAVEPLPPPAKPRAPFAAAITGRVAGA